MDNLDNDIEESGNPVFENINLNNIGQPEDFKEEEEVNNVNINNDDTDNEGCSSSDMFEDDNDNIIEYNF